MMTVNDLIPVHEDMIIDMRQDSYIEVDGKYIFENK